jgi:PAS domain-containing protein
MTRRRRLSHLLLASHVGLVLLFAALLIATGIGTIRSAVSAQASSEAERSVAESRQRLQSWQRELDVGADLLAEQPTLRFYVLRGQQTKARALATAFHRTSQLEYVRVEYKDRLIAELGRPPPSLESGLAFDQHDQPWRIVQREMKDLPGSAWSFAERLGRRLSSPEGSALVTIELLPLPRAPPTANADPWSRALYRVSNSGEPETFRQIAGSAAARVISVRDEHGQPRGLLSARVQQDWVERKTLEVVRRLRAVRPAHARHRAGDRRSWCRRASAVPSWSWPTTPTASAAATCSRRSPAGKLPRRPRHSRPGSSACAKRVATLTATERSQREELDAVLDGVDEGIVAIDPEGRVHYANRQFLALVGARARGCARPATSPEFMLPVEARAPEPGRFPRFGAAARALRRHRLAAPADRAPAVGQRRRELLVVREENAIEAARAMRDRILANLSHEFQTPLSAQMASIELLRDHLRGSEDAIAVQLADAQYRGSMRLSQLVDNLLDSVRIESGEMRLRRQPVDLAAVVREAVELITPLTDQREQRVLATLAAGPSLTAIRSGCSR